MWGGRVDVPLEGAVVYSLFNARDALLTRDSGRPRPVGTSDVGRVVVLKSLARGRYSRRPARSIITAVSARCAFSI